MESEHPIDRPIGCEFSQSVIILEIWQAEVASRLRFRQQICVIWKNDPLWGNLQNSVPKGFMATLIHNLCVNFVKFGGPEIGKVVHYLPHKKQFRLALASARIAPKICHGKRQTTYSECPKFHANRFTSGRVTAECMNTVKMHRKVFPIFGWSLASSRIIMLRKVQSLFTNKKQKKSPIILALVFRRWDSGSVYISYVKHN